MNQAKSATFESSPYKTSSVSKAKILNEANKRSTNSKLASLRPKTFLMTASYKMHALRDSYFVKTV